MAVDSPIAATPEPPYTAVIFSSLRSATTVESTTATARQPPGWKNSPRSSPAISASNPPVTRRGLGISVSYWVDESAARAWKQVAEHLVAQERGATEWYAEYRVRVATVTREYGAPA